MSKISNLQSLTVNLTVLVMVICLAGCHSSTLSEQMYIDVYQSINDIGQYSHAEINLSSELLDYLHRHRVINEINASMPEPEHMTILCSGVASDIASGSTGCQTISDYSVVYAAIFYDEDNIALLTNARMPNVFVILNENEYHLHTRSHLTYPMNYSWKVVVPRNIYEEHIGSVEVLGDLFIAQSTEGKFKNPPPGLDGSEHTLYVNYKDSTFISHTFSGLSLRVPKAMQDHVGEPYTQIVLINKLIENFYWIYGEVGDDGVMRSRKAFSYREEAGSGLGVKKETMRNNVADLSPTRAGRDQGCQEADRCGQPGT